MAGAECILTMQTHAHACDRPGPRRPYVHTPCDTIHNYEANRHSCRTRTLILTLFQTQNPPAQCRRQRERGYTAASCRNDCTAPESRTLWRRPPPGLCISTADDEANLE